MRIVYLMESAADLWGGVKVVLEDANALHDRGHHVTVMALTGRPGWMDLRCHFLQVKTLDPKLVPAADVVIATFWTTVEMAVQADRGPVVHFVQGHEADFEPAPLRPRIEAAYRLPTQKISVAPHLTTLLGKRYGGTIREVPQGVDERTFWPGPFREAPRPLRIGLVGPYEVAFKGIPTGLAALDLAWRAGLDLQLVRIINTTPHPAEAHLPMPVEFHQQVPPDRMGDLYRSLDLFVGPSHAAEGFFLPALEAMTCGIPCVLTDAPCHHGYGTGHYALFVPPQDPQALAEAIVSASPAAVRRSLREQGLEIAAGFQRSAHVDALEDALKEIAARSPDPQPESMTIGVAQALRELAALHLDAGDHETARRHLEAVHCLFPADPIALQSLAELHHAAGDLTGAASWLIRLAECTGDPAAAAAAANRAGVLCFAAGDRDRARAAFTQALAVHPGSADARENLRAL